MEREWKDLEKKLSVISLNVNKIKGRKLICDIFKRKLICDIFKCLQN